MWRLRRPRAIFVSMRRSPMPPARSVPPRYVAPALATGATDLVGAAGAERQAGAPAPAPPLVRLLGPLPALPRLRRLFDPRGWFRRIEREASFLLSADVFPWIPGISRPYALQLDRSLTVSEAEIDVPALPTALDGLKVLLITDVHVGPFLRPDALQRAFDRLRTLEPDLILIGGDITTA